ncbi:hypothetical protein [Lysinibacillus sp. NPDC056232]|uniref:hypothetical protein n=1 Tax=Lysinibacillus sp. NPDC056232 TaxID=3345756 RepID=UPI0035D5BC91
MYKQITKEQDIVSLMQKIVDHFDTIHILINNAGKFQHKSFYGGMTKKMMYEE